MKVTFILPCFSRRPIGGLRVVYELANGLVKRGHQVTALHPRTLPGREPTNGIRAHLSRMLNECVAVRGVPWMDIERDVDMVYVHDVSESTTPDADVLVVTNWQTAKAADPLSGAKGHRHYLVQDFYPYLAPKSVLQDSWRSGYRLAAVSQWLADMVLASGVDPASVVRISNGISLIHGMRVPPEKRRRSIAMMYGLANYKAIEVGLEALRLVRDMVGPMPVRLFGANTSRRPTGLPNWASYDSLLSDRQVSDLYNDSAVFVSSSAAEGFCLPAAEAMASGCAVVATDSGGIRDFATHGENAFLSEPGNTRLLAENIANVLTDEPLRHRLAMAGVEKMRAFTWPAAVERFERFIQFGVGSGGSHANLHETRALLKGQS